MFNYPISGILFIFVYRPHPHVPLLFLLPFLKVDLELEQQKGKSLRQRHSDELRAATAAVGQM